MLLQFNRFSREILLISMENTLFTYVKLILVVVRAIMRSFAYLVNLTIINITVNDNEALKICAPCRIWSAS